MPGTPPSRYLHSSLLPPLLLLFLSDCRVLPFSTLVTQEAVDDGNYSGEDWLEGEEEEGENFALLLLHMAWSLLV